MSTRVIRKNGARTRDAHAHARADQVWESAAKSESQKVGESAGTGRGRMCRRERETRGFLARREERSRCAQQRRRRLRCIQEGDPLHGCGAGHRIQVVALGFSHRAAVVRAARGRGAAVATPFHFAPIGHLLSATADHSGLITHELAGIHGLRLPTESKQDEDRYEPPDGGGGAKKAHTANNSSAYTN